jgi:hypothetical protein
LGVVNLASIGVFLLDPVSKPDGTSSCQNVSVLQQYDGSAAPGDAHDTSLLHDEVSVELVGVFDDLTRESSSYNIDLSVGKLTRLNKLWNANLGVDLLLNKPLTFEV